MIVTDSYARIAAEDTTAPIVCLDLAEKIAAVDRFALDAPNVLDDWTVIIDPELDGWVIRWHYLRITVGARSDLNLAIYIARQRAEGLALIRAAACEARIALGWHPRHTPTVLCRTCRTTSTVTTAHPPRSPECWDTLAERRIAHAE